jgi:predicted Zn finger-like uncharacterized protein
MKFNGRRTAAAFVGGCARLAQTARRALPPSRHARLAGLARSVGQRAHMPNPNWRPFFRCPSCKALYQVVKAEVGPETEVACGVCSGPLVAREGQFVLKYFLLRKAILRRAKLR